MLELVPTMLEARSQVQQTFQVDCLEVFQEAPWIRIVYFAGSLQEVVLKLPIVLDKFLVPSSDIDLRKFNDKWDDLHNNPLTSRNNITIATNSTMDVSRLKTIIGGHHWGMVGGFTDEHTLLAASILHMQEQKIGCLLRLTFSELQESIEIEVRASTSLVAELLQITLSRSLTTSLTIPVR